MEVRVRLGDSLWYYSQLFFVPLPLIIDSNRNVNPSRIQIGEQILIPGFVTESYTIGKGDNFWKLARERNLSVDALLLLNQNLNPNRLQIGDKIVLPKRVVAPALNRRRNYDFSFLQSDIDQLKAIYPFIQINTIGHSVLGKPLYEIRLGRGNKKVHMNASFHANEWITSAMIMEFLNTFLIALTNSTSLRNLSALPLYEQVDLSIVPMVNPDGVDLVLNGPQEEVKENVLDINKGSTDFSGWKANIRGVDLNNQFPAKWEIEKERKEPKAPAPRDYPGEAPLTEPEVIAIANLTRERQFDRVIAFHTQGKEFYWGYEGFEPPLSQLMADEFERVSGYRAIQYIDSHAGYKDWFIQDFRKPGFTIEFGFGVNPLPIDQFDEIYQQGLGIFLASLYM